MTAGYTLHTSDSQSSDFDHIIYAIDGEEILKICGSLLDVQEINIISELRTSKTVGVLHSDTSVSDCVLKFAPLRALSLAIFRRLANIY